MTLLRYLFRNATTLGLILAATWLAGFFLFVGRVTAYIEPIIDEEIVATDAAVVLTGGSERVAAGLELLRAGKARKLFISGVHPSVNVKELVQKTPIPDDLRTCCVILGKEADNTIGNALETQSFMEDNNFKSLRLVTAHYHMPRSLFLFNQMMPSARIYLYPVTPDAVDLRNWWKRPNTLSLLAWEYCKYLFVRLLWMLEPAA